jgi:hypothetical protein
VKAMIVDFFLIKKEGMSKDGVGLEDERWDLIERFVRLLLVVECECSVGSKVLDFNFFKRLDEHFILSGFGMSSDCPRHHPSSS